MTHKFLCNFVVCTKCLSVEQAAKLASVLLLIPRNINRELEIRLGFFLFLFWEHFTLFLKVYKLFIHTKLVVGCPSALRPSLGDVSSAQQFS